MSALFLQKNAHHSEDFFRIGIFKQHKDSGPSNFLFQIARGSRATLSECTFSFKKAHVTQNTSSRQTTSRPQDKKNPDIAISELFLTKRTRTQLNQSSFQQGSRGTFQCLIRKISRKDPQAPCAKQQEARELHPNGSSFFFKKVHTSEDLTKRYTVLLKKALGRCLFLLDKI